MESELENYRHPDAFGRWLGYQVLKRTRATAQEPASAQVYLQIREDHLSPAQRAHGGVISALFDIACGAAVFSTLGPKDYCSTVELKVNYLRPIHLGDHLVAQAQVVFRGKRLCVLQAQAFCQDSAPLPGPLESGASEKGPSQPVAIATATFNVVSSS
jgi:uncharacterized protein (TIGR00369 family)